MGWRSRALVFIAPRVDIDELRPRGGAVPLHAGKRFRPGLEELQGLGLGCSR